VSDVVVGGDPDLLEAYSDEVLGLFASVREALTAYQDAVVAFNEAPSEMDVAVVDRSLDVEQGLFDLEEADRIPGAFGGLLREFDGQWEDAVLADLIGEDPEVAARLAGGWSDGEVQGEEAVALLLAFFGDVEVAGQDAGDADGKLSRDDLERIAGDEDQPEALRNAARWMLDNEEFYDVVDGIESGGTDGEISDEDLVELLVMNRHLRNLEGEIDAVDVAADGDGEVDGNISMDDLEAVANGEGEFSDGARAAAQYLLGSLQARAGLGIEGVTAEGLYGRLDRGQAFANESPHVRQEFDVAKVEADTGETAPSLTDIQMEEIREAATQAYESLDNVGLGACVDGDLGPVGVEGCGVVNANELGFVVSAGTDTNPASASGEIGGMYTNAEDLHDIEGWGVSFSAAGSVAGVSGDVTITASINPDAITPEGAIDPDANLFTGDITVVATGGVGVDAPSMGLSWTEVRSVRHGIGDRIGDVMEGFDPRRWRPH
jgi:hypothetical protein